VIKKYNIMSSELRESKGTSQDMTWLKAKYAGRITQKSPTIRIIMAELLSDNPMLTPHSFLRFGLSQDA
jgi:hypothetical protein